MIKEYLNLKWIMSQKKKWNINKCNNNNQTIRNLFNNKINN